MGRLQNLIKHPYFSYFYVFVVVFCLICLLTLPQGHTLTTYAVIAGVLMFVLHRYRKWLLKQH
ncbi:hypothetical protein [Parapedobacter sp. 10938]|uniref:hypothetical protein n=1 Tax=Parapedobacter flavus TaxID=3110225 RepID=UPI002DB7DDD1|nr:hypothetical protein [Parapedobacter sp. 10938]MEC3878028.1 hypothetical protein [Parapedobacter sp. 10938]